ncbi:hypothetical protein BC828DRAFT_209579 [Blastocladiella britannica]|nr:hypothetical protein BC828DRAFT_209579 [Blastocladiella britannica]
MKTKAAGRGLFNVSANPLSKMDPFVRVTLGNTKHQTDVADNGHAAPQWTKQAPLAFPVSSRPDKSERSIQIDVIHKGFLSEKQVGYNLEVSIAPVLKRGASTRDHPGFDEWVEIRTVAGKAGGEIRLSLWFEPNVRSSSSFSLPPQ